MTKAANDKTTSNQLLQISWFVLGRCLFVTVLEAAEYTTLNWLILSLSL